jgi:hypothetical protein
MVERGQGLGVADLAPAVIVHGLEAARAVVGLAGELRRPVTLLSAEGAACYAGVGWWQALVDSARQGAAGADVADILDCGAAPGRALEALRARQGLIILRARPDVWADIAARAASQGAVLLDAAPAALDMGARGAARHLPAWITDGARLKPRAPGEDAAGAADLEDAAGAANLEDAAGAAGV